MNINEINDALIKASNKVTDLNAQITNAVLSDKFDEEDVTALKNQRDTEIKRRDTLNDQLTQARLANKIEKPKVTTIDNNKSDNQTFVDNFKGMLRNDPKIVNQVTSSKDPNGDAIGLTVPQDIQTKINQLIRQYDSLQPYVRREAVSVPTGSRVYEKWSDIQPLKSLDAEDKLIPDNDDPKLTQIKFNIERYAGITTATNTLLKDTSENIIAWLTSWISKKIVVTRNAKIIDQMNAVPKKPTIAKFDDIIDLANLAVDPAIGATAFFLTNTSGFNALSKVKDAFGQYLVQPNVTNPAEKQIYGKRVVVVGDRWLPSVAGSMPLYFGDLSQAVTLFDREQMSILTTNIGAGAFEHDTTKIRVIDRFDVEATDTEAFVAGSFKAIADQPTTISLAGSKESDSPKV
ncbi:phage major capsid protein [Lactiplantibacillus plantarum]|uniref:phage major capsid protein n=1 Tax=Lactiplantibacillus plantarum TaxID=1590 RepID=UPI003C6D3FB1